MMKTGLLLLFVVLCVSFSRGQVTAPVRTSELIESDTTSSIAWDSTYIGGGTVYKTVEFDNDGSVSLYIAMANDTSGRGSEYHHYHTVKTTEREFTSLVAPGITFVRTRAASGTCARRIKVWR